MDIVIDQLASSEYTSFESFVKECSLGLIYNSESYIRTIEQIVQPDEIVTLVAKQDNRVTGSVVLFIKRAQEKSVVNALPYFGSHGDILTADDVGNRQEITSHLLGRIISLCEEQKIGAINIVGHPLQSYLPGAIEGTGVSVWDRRIGQISQLPHASNPDDALKAVLLMCNPKTRNLVRKGLRANFDIEISQASADWALLFEHHKLSMERINGRFKQQFEFDAIRKHLEPVNFCKLYVARKDGDFAGALLNLYYNGWVEYFAPVSVAQYRGEQVMSALIATAMKHACVDGAHTWNWGGTWPSQAGVYHFKKGWGASDHLYPYVGTVWDQGLATMTPETLRASFPYFYVRPF